MIKLVRVLDQELDALLDLARSTFKVSFEQQNKPEDFKLYMEKAFSRSVFKDQLRDPNSSFYFVRQLEETVGYIKINEKEAQNEQFDTQSIELERFYIKSSFQGQNIGKEVLKLVLDMVKNTEATFLWLGVWEKNAKAIRFYERHGFKKFGSHPYYLGNDKQTDYLMKIDLTSPLPL